MSTHAWHVARTPNLEIAVRWPGGRVPASLIVDDPMPGLNPMIDHEPGHPHRKAIPNEVLRRFADLADEHGIQGKFTVVPWPLALGRLDRPETLPAESRAALPEFADIVRSRIVPRFDLTCEFLTHSRAIDVRTEQPMEATERQWASHASAEDFAAAIGLAARILGDAGLVMEGVTSPWDSGRDNEGAYAAGVALAARRRGRRMGWYFLHGSGTLDVLPRIAHQDAESIAVSVVAGAGDDPGWGTQYGRPAELEPIIDADGGGRVRTLVEAGLPVVLITHWQSLYGNGSLGGLHALDLLGARLRAQFRDAVEWTPLRRHAELAAACAGLRVREVGGGGADWAVAFETPYACALAEVEVRGISDEGRRWVRLGAQGAFGGLHWNGVALAGRGCGEGAADGRGVRAEGEGAAAVRADAVRVHMPLCDGLLTVAAV